MASDPLRLTIRLQALQSARLSLVPHGHRSFPRDPAGDALAATNAAGGGDGNTGAVLVAESWPTEFRAKAISIVQSSWALGFAAAALVAGPVARYYGWRAVFFVGILPAIVTLWIQRSVPESEMWRERTTG